MATSQRANLYTGNNVLIRANNQIIGLVETLTISRAVNRHPAYGVGSPLWIDAPVTQASVTVTATNMVPNPTVATPAPGLAQEGLVPSGSLVNEVLAGTMDLEILDYNTGQTVYYVNDAYYNQDAVQVPGTELLTVNCSWIARDSQAWT